MKKHTLITILALVATSATASISLKLSLKTPDSEPLEISKVYSDNGKIDLSTSNEDMYTPKAAAKTRAAAASIITPAFQNPIHDEDLGSTGTLYTIKSSGRYYLAGDLFATVAGTSIGILVNVPNVTLNMNSKAIMPHVGSSATTGTAIQIAAGVSNTQVMNGTIQSADSDGTQRFAKGLEVLTTGTVNNTVKLQNIHITRLTESSNACRGFDLNGVNDLSMENCNVNDCNISSASGAKVLYAANLDTVNNFIIKGCEFNNNTAVSSDSTVTLAGIRLSSSADGLIENTIAANNRGDASGGTADTYGILSSSSRSIVMKNVSASSNVSDSSTLSGSSCAGIYLTASPLCSLVDCSANNNSDAGTGAHPTGIWLASSSDSCNLVRCHAEQNNTSVSSSSAYGIRVESDNNMLEDCRANANSGNIETYGIYLSGSTENKLSGCHANYNQSTAEEAYGVFMTSSSNNNHFKNCHANGNQSTANSKGVAGFYSTGGSDNIFELCAANGNDTYPDGAETGTTAAGFRLAGTETRCQLLNCRAIGNRGGTTSSFAYGVYLEDASNCTVKNCYLAHNTVTNGAAFGYADDSSTSTTLLVNNLAVGQGKCLGGTLDASLQWNGNTKPTSSNQNYYFQHAGTGDDPRNVVQEAPLANFLSISTTVGDWTNISLY